MKPNIRSLIIYLITLASLASAIYYLANYYTTTQGISLFYTPSQITIAHTLISLLCFIIVLIVNLYRPLYTAFAFMGALWISLRCVIIAMIPIANSNNLNPYHEALFIVIPSFVMIAIETTFAIQLVKLTNQKINKSSN